jgi:hypothetical protein
MALIWKRYDYFNPLFVAIGLVWTLGGLYAAWRLGWPWPKDITMVPMWSIPVLFTICGVVILIHQYKKRPR